jgi:hypothetical protein
LAPRAVRHKERDKLDDMSRDLMLDGNAVAGLLHDIFGA